MNDVKWDKSSIQVIDNLIREKLGECYNPLDMKWKICMLLTNNVISLENVRLIWYSLLERNVLISLSFSLQNITFKEHVTV